jgi:drug/metabolite transporter (DMT)-like permease
MSPGAARLKAVQMLILCTAFWGLSFPTTKALAITQQKLLPDASSWFVASLCIVYRFAIAALIMLLLSVRTLRMVSREELKQGIGLGIFAGGGILLQVDGLAYTSASTSAFLTQCYCVIIPIWVAWRQRRWPAANVLLSCALVVAGVAILANVEWRDFRLGRGELETIAASVLFTGQIFWLERPRYARNNVNHFSLVMFLVMSLVCLPVALLTTQQPVDWLRAYESPATLGFLGILVLFCTCGGYLMMNHWQRRITATEAGLIYCIEPVFASLFAWFMPAWFSTWAVIDYPNETLTLSLLIGGGLITAANIIIQMPIRPSASPQRDGPVTSLRRDSVEP